VRAHTAAKELPLKLVIGTELDCVAGTSEDALKLVVLAEHGQAYAALCGLITRARLAAPKGEYRLSRDDVAECLQAHGTLLWLPGFADHAADLCAGRWL
jgi:error-prone DNA polymerase